MSNAVIIRDVIKRYGKFTAVNGINLNIRQGEFFTLLGPSGCGKTTLLRMIAGFNSIEAGDILFGEKRMNDVPAHKRDIGMVFQNYAIFPHLTVEENVAYGLKAKHLPAKEIATRVAEALELVQIQQLAKRKPSELSGGQQQRVALARAFVIEPSVLLMDEPLSNLDAKLRVQMRSIIKKLQRRLGITTIYVTHDQDEAMIMSDVINLFHDGKIEQSGTPEQIYTRPATRFAATFIGNYNLLDAKDFNRAFGTAIPKPEVAVRPEIISLSKRTIASAEGLLVARGKIAGYISHGNLIRFSIDVKGLLINADVLFEDKREFGEGDEVFVAVKEDLVIGL